MRASASISFSKADSVYFLSTRLTFHCIENLSDVGKGVMDAFKRGKWEGDHVFVHSTFASDGTTILISRNDGAVIEIEANVTGIQELDLADASAGLFFKNERDVGLKVIAQTGLVPLLNLSAVRPRNRWLPFIGGKTVQPLLMTAVSKASVVPLPGALISSLEPEISPQVAKDIGKDIDDVFQVVEIP